PVFGEGYAACFFILLIIAFFQEGNQAVHLHVEYGVILRRAGNNERRARFVDQDGIHFVNDGIVERPLDHILQRVFHIVAQIIKAIFIVGAVGNVSLINGTAFLVFLIVLNAADRKAKRFIHLAHPFRVAAGEVIVDR